MEAVNPAPYVVPFDSRVGASVFPHEPIRRPASPDRMALTRSWASSPPAQTVELAQCWHELAGGRRQIADSSCSDEYYFLLLTRAVKPRRARRGLGARNFRVLSQVLLTPSRKQLSAQIGFSASSIAALSKQSLTAIGLSCTASRAPALLIMAAGAASAQTFGAAGWIGERLLIAPHFELVRAPRPELQFASAFSRAEFDVAQRLLEGDNYAEIAARRQTSARTIANQVASVFRRVGVSGRSELAQRLLLRPSQSGAIDVPTRLRPQPAQLPPQGHSGNSRVSVRIGGAASAPLDAASGAVLDGAEETGF